MSRRVDRTPTAVRSRAVVGLVGALVGGIVGAVVALNVAIFAGVERGYETSLSELFERRPATAIVVVVVLLVSPLIGAGAALRWRRSSNRSS